MEWWQGYFLSEVQNNITLCIILVKCCIPVSLQNVTENGEILGMCLLVVLLTPFESMRFEWLNGYGAMHANTGKMGAFKMFYQSALIEDYGL